MIESNCPHDGSLLPLVSGGDGAAHVHAHVGQCEACQKKLEQMRISIDAIRDAAQSPTVSFGLSESESDASVSAFRSQRSLDHPAERFLPAIGKYLIVGRLGVGGQAEVFRAIHPALQKELVIKLGRQCLGTRDEARERIVAEGRLLAELDQPGLARVYDLDFHQNRPFLVMELVRGRNLAQVAHDAPFSPRRAIAMVAALARAIDTAHRKGVIHQDIKPENILLDEDGSPWIVDFGMARLRDAWSTEANDVGTISGTVEYMAPEQARGEIKNITPRTDVFALGAVLYFLLVGEAPYEGEDRKQCLRRAQSCDFDHAAIRASGAPADLANVCLTAMASQPENRYASAIHMAEALERTLARRSLMPRRGALICAVLAAGLFLGWWRPWQSRPPPSPDMEASLQVAVLRDGRSVHFVDALPLRTGDKLSISAEYPAEFKAALFWLDSEGMLHLLSPLTKTSAAGGSLVRIEYPTQGRVVPLEGKPGTELVLLCADPSRSPRLRDLEDVFEAGKPWPDLPPGIRLIAGLQGPCLAGLRRPGAPEKPSVAALNHAKSVWPRLVERFALVEALGFTHRE